MKRYVVEYSILILMMFLLCSTIKTRVVAAEKDWEYSEDENGICITAYNGLDKEIIIPTTLGGEKVVAIGDSVFDENETITQVVIPESVAKIGMFAFYGCVNLTKVELNDGVKSIGREAFAKCARLTEITIPKSVEKINSGAFYRCYTLDKIVVDEGNVVYDSRNDCNAIIETNSNKLIRGGGLTVIPDDVICIGDSAFCGCNNLSKIVIPDSVVEIEWQAFNGCSNLKEIKLPNKIKTIPNGMFVECTKLSNIEIPDGVEAISDTAFKYCSGLQEIKIPNSVTSIGRAAFSGCSKLETIKLPNTIQSIEDLLFEYCSNLKSVEIPEGVTSIGPRVFQYCKNLEVVTIPDSVNTIGVDIFAYAKDDVTVKCYKNSIADIYAKEKNLNIVYIGVSQKKDNVNDAPEKDSDENKSDNNGGLSKNEGDDNQNTVGKNQDNTIEKTVEKQNTEIKKVNCVGDAITIGNLIYHIISDGEDDNGEVELYQTDKKKQSKLKSVRIPEIITCNYGSYKVTMISPNALSKCKKLKKITIESKILTQKFFSKKVFKKLGENITISVPKSCKKKYAKWLKKAGFKGKVQSK